METLDIKWTHLTEVLNEFADFFIQEARGNLDRNQSNASYSLYNSFEKIIEIGEDYYSVKISLEDYWKYTEEGRGPGKFPPPDTIARWIDVKGITPYPDSNGRIPSVDQLTYLIGRKISIDGTEPHPFFEPAREEAIEKFELAIDQAISLDIEDFINESVDRMFDELKNF